MSEPTTTDAAPEITREDVARYLRWMANRLGLRDWSFTIAWSEQPEDDAYASIECVFGRKLAVIRFRDDFLDLDHEVQRHAVVHELIHAHSYASTLTIRNDEVMALLGEPAWKLLWHSFVHHYEFGVDGLTDAVAPLLPLIVEVASGQTRWWLDDPDEDADDGEPADA